MNVLFRSALRRRAGTIVLALLFALAAFVAVLRVTENIVVRGQIAETAEFYRGVGYITHADAFGDVSYAVHLLENSPQVEFADRRRGAQVFLHGMLNADITGTSPNLQVYPQVEKIQNHTALVYATVTTVTYSPVRAALIDGEMRIIQAANEYMQFRVDEIIFGRREHVFVGQFISIDTFDLPEKQFGEQHLLLLEYTRQYSPPQGMGVTRFNPEYGPWVPRSGRRHPMRLLPMPDDFDPVAAAADWERANSQLFVQTTRDMELLMTTHPAMRLREGRPITREDYAQGARVAVVDVHFATVNRIEVGDTITVDVPLSQSIAGTISHPATPAQGGFSGRAGFSMPLVLAQRGAQYTTLELEVVGITQFVSFNRCRVQSLFVFVPDSVLPQDFYIAGGEYIPAPWFGFTLADLRNQHLFAYTYAEEIERAGLTLVVHYENASGFWSAAAPIMLAMTFNLILFGVMAATVMLLAVFLYLRRHANEAAIMRALGRRRAGLLAVLLAVGLFIAVPAMAVGAGAAAVYGSFHASRVTARLGEAYDETQPPSDLELQWEAIFGTAPPETYAGRRRIDPTADISPRYAAVTALGLAAAVLVMLLAGAVAMLRRPVLAQLQGASAPPPAADSSAVPVSAAEPRDFDTLLTLPPLPRLRKARRAYSLSFALRHIRRAPARTLLAFAVAAAFTLALGWLLSSARDTNEQIDALYRTTYVTGHVQSGNGAIRHAIRALLDTDYFKEAYVETLANNIRPLSPVDGALPEDWRTYDATPPPEFVDYVRELLGEVYLQQPWFLDLQVEFMWQQYLSMDVFGVSDAGQFIHRLGEPVQIDGADDSAYAPHIRFAPGFDEGIFATREFAQVPAHMPLPVFVSEEFLAQEEKELGDTLFIIFNPFGMHGSENYHEAIIAGVYYGLPLVPFGLPPAIMPYWAMQAFGSAYHYIAMEFTIDPAFNRELRDTLLSLRTTANPRQRSDGALISVADDELRTVMNTMTQMLLLTSLFMRVVIILAVCIGGGLAFLLAAAHTKNAALARALGMSKKSTAAMLCAEQLLICAAGIVTAAIILPAAGAYMPLVLVAGAVYAISVGAGLTAGIVLTLRKAPMELLQVRE